MNVSIRGVATTKFGELWDVSPRTLATAAVMGAIKDAEIAKQDIQALFVGNMLSGMLGGQEHLGAFFSEELRLNVPAYKVEGACASGGLAFHAGVTSILSGQYDTVVVLGIEKMTDYKPEEVARALMGAGSDAERLSGATFPGLYACLARAHMEKYQTTEEDMARVAVKNHFHASLNPNAQYHSPLTVERVMRSTCIADPLKLFDCSPISDGAAAVVITRARTSGKQKRRQGVSVAASAVATDTLGLAERESLTELKASKVAGLRAYDMSSVGPEDIDVAEVHDCFTIAEILAMEDLGFYNKGEAAGGISRGDTTLGTSKRLLVNPSGGLKGCGHPVGATGVKQIVELVLQLQGVAEKRQALDARVALAHNVGGSGGTAVVHILQI